MSPKIITRLTDLLSDKTLGVSRILDPLNALVLDAPTPEAFQAHACLYAQRACQTFKKQRADLFEMAGRIRDIKRRSWMNDPDIINMWFQVTTQYLQRFSEHPSKKVAAIVVDANNNMICWGVNRIPAGIGRLPARYAEGIRKNYIVCAERNMFAHYQGLGITLFDGLTPSDAAIRETVVNYSDSTIYWGSQRPLPEGSWMFVSNLPCTACREAIIAHRPETFVTDFEAGSHFKRAGSRRENYKAMCAAGIKVLNIHQIAA